jgi:ElaB/YqjD/DUF883 family membrane-anchored ribosome-binding protein
MIGALTGGRTMRQEVAVKEGNKRGFFNKAFDAAEQVVSVGIDADRLKVRAEHAIEDGMADAKRLVKKGRYAAMDLMDDTEHLIKKEPFRSVGIMFGVGVGLGVITGWLLTRRRDHF